MTLSHAEVQGLIIAGLALLAIPLVCLVTWLADRRAR